MLARQPALAAAEGQSGDAGGRDGSDRRRELERLGFTIKFGPNHPRLGPDNLRRGFDANALHAGQVNHQPGVADSLATDVVPPALDRDEGVVFAGEADRRRHIGSPGAADDQRRPTIDHAIPDDSRVVISCIAQSEQRAAQAARELLEFFLLDDCVGAVDGPNSEIGHYASPCSVGVAFYTAASPACRGHLPASGNSEGILAPSIKQAGLPVQTQRFHPIDELISARMAAMRKLPPLKALRAFEAAARHMSFTAAADELGLTPTAISHQIRLLETA